MREYLFRGKREDNGEGAYGYYVKSIRAHGSVSTPPYKIAHQIRSNENNKQCCVEVFPETVGEWTGLTDKNGKKIFEGDIVECKWFNAMVRIEHRKHLIIFSDGSFCAEWYIGQDNYHNDLHNTFDRKVIGNKWDSPELLQDDNK